MANDTVTVWGGVPRIGRAPANNELLIGNGSGFTLQTVAITLDNILGSTQGSIAYRSASQWTQLVPATSGFLLQTNGASANPSWVSLGTSFDNYFGSATGLVPLRTPAGWGTISIGPLGTVFASNGSLPAWASVSDLFDVDFTNARQAIITRGASSWTYLPPTTTPNLILTNNSGNATSDIGWTTISNAISNGTAGTTLQGDMIYFGPSALQKLNIGANGTILTSSGGTTPAWSTVSSALDTGIGNTVGGLLYRSSGGSWANSGAGSTGNALVAQGPGANPAWEKAFSLKSKPTGQSITSSATYSDDSVLQFSVAANSVYSFWGTVFYVYTTSGFDFAMNGPSGATVYVETLTGVNVNSANAFDTVAATAPSLPASSTASGVFFKGVLITSSTAGTFTVRSKLQTGSTASTVGEGSFMQLVRA